MKIGRTGVPAPAWMQDQLTATLAWWRRGEITGCPHIMDGSATHIHMAAWKPETLSCPDCSPVVLHVEDRGRCCDLCGRDVPLSETLLVLSVDQSDASFFAGVCLSCAPDAVLTDEERAMRGPIAQDHDV